MTLIETTTVTLDPGELDMAERGGEWRQRQNIAAGLRNAYGLESEGLEEHKAGARAEVAVAKWLGRYWSPGQRGAGDVGPYQVRYASKATYSLILHPADDDRAPFILVVGEAPYFTLVGWIWGVDGKQEQFWSEPVKGRAAYFVPQSALYRMDELITGLWD